MELWGMERQNKDKEQEEIKFKYRMEYVGHGPKATGFMSKKFKRKPGLYARCTQCGCYMEIASDHEDRCICGSLFKDARGDKFGSAFGANEIEVFRAVPK